MEMLAVRIHPFNFSLSTPKINVPGTKFSGSFAACHPFGKGLSFANGHEADGRQKRRTNRFSHAIRAVSSGLVDTEVSSSSFGGFNVTASSADKGNELKISMEVSGGKTQEIFDDVFSKMVADAQPIPGFRRVKGGKTPNIPKDILLEILGPSNVYKSVITKIINISVAEYAVKESLTLGKDLQVEQSFEDLEAGFVPGEKFRFDAIVHLLKYI